MTLNDKFMALIEEKRMELGMTQGDFALAVFVGQKDPRRTYQSTLHKSKRDSKRNFSLDEAQRMAKAVDEHFASLMFEITK